MSDVEDPHDSLVVHDLTLRIEEARDALAAIRSGEVDALVIAAGDERRVFILKGADHAHRVLFETLNEGAMTIASDSTILSANRRSAELLGRPLEKVLGVPLTQLLAPGAHPFERLAREADTGGSKGEIALERPDGERIPVMLSMSAIIDGDDRTYTAVMTDLRPMQAAQRALERANGELEQRVEARTRELEDANRALRDEIAARTRLEGELRSTAAQLLEADRRKDEFLSMLAHELRNPLAPILTAAEMIRLHTGAHPALERYRNVIQRQVHNLTRLVDDLLDVSRITRRVITLRAERCDLRPIIAAAIEAARPLIDDRGHELSVSLPRAPVTIVADPTRFEQVLVNLLNNAAKYTDRGGKIHLSMEVGEAEVAIRVRDTGVGIPPELLAHVFDLFVQGERSLDRSQGGLGIGLTLVKSLVEMHGGKIEGRSDGIGAGSEFTVRMPLAPAIAALDGEPPPVHPSAPPPNATPSSAPPPSAEAVVPSSSGTSRGRVLLVEDNADAIATMSELLELWGYDVMQASDGHAALERAASFVPDAVLIDIGLPGMDGYEVARRLRGTRPRPLVVAISGYGPQPPRGSTRHPDIDHHLMKPPDPEVLQGILAAGRSQVGSRPID